MNKRIYNILLATILIAIVPGCGRSRRYFPRHTAPEHITVVRFDSALIAWGEQSDKVSIQALTKAYPDFMPFYCEAILGVSAQDTDYLAQALPMYLNDTLYGFQATNKVVEETFRDFSQVSKPLDRAFGRIKYLYPEWPMPKLYTFVSGFNGNVLFMDDDMAVGLDMYLGSDYPYYNHVVYQYQKQTMRPECIAADLTSAYLFKNIPYTSTKQRLIDQMLYRGKVMYMLSVIMDDTPNYEIMGYTREQWDWAMKHERQVWNRIMDKRDLFKTEQLMLTGYLNDGPFTSEISQEAPPRLGTWIGWRIAESYMAHHDQITLQQLISEGDAEMILRESYYRP